MVVENMASELSGTIDDNALKSAKTILERLRLSEAETTKLKGLPITEAADRALIKKFAENKKVSPQETARIMHIISGSTLEDSEKTRFTQLLDDTTQRNVEKDLFNLLFNKENLKDKKIKLTGPAITEDGLNLIRQYLADTSQANRNLLDEKLIEKGIIDEEQLKTAARIFDYDPVIHYMHDTPKFENKYKALIERCRNEIMEQEIFQCMQRAADETPETRLIMLKNHYLMNSSWDGNERLTGIMRENGTKKVSSYYLYNEMFSRTRTPEQEQKPFVNYLQKLLDKIKPKAQKGNKNNYDGATDAIQDAIKSSGGMSKGLKIALGAGAALLAIGGGYYAMNKSGSKSNDHGDTFKPSSQPALKNPYLTTK